MNGKKAKRIRSRARDMACQYIREKVLDPDLTDGKDCASIMVALPKRMLVMNRRVLSNGVFTQRWWDRMAKRHPEKLYEDYIDEVYGAS